jgi:hypothetical protein
MKGKERCKILKDIRRRIAEENDIEFIVSECKHKGDCRGTCPKCEAELRYLERELEKRRKKGLAVSVAGLAITVSLAATSCDLDSVFTTQGDMEGPPVTTDALGGEDVLPGAPETLPPELSGEPLPETDDQYTDLFEGEIILPGDIVAELPTDTESDTDKDE